MLNQRSEQPNAEQDWEKDFKQKQVSGVPAWLTNSETDTRQQCLLMFSYKCVGPLFSLSHTNCEGESWAKRLDSVAGQLEQNIFYFCPWSLWKTLRLRLAKPVLQLNYIFTSISKEGETIFCFKIRWRILGILHFYLNSQLYKGAGDKVNQIQSAPRTSFSTENFSSTHQESFPNVGFCMLSGFAKIQVIKKR